MEKEALIIDDLHHKYDNQKISNWILNAINFKIEKGQLLGLLGPSGCGKTTLLRLIAGFEYPVKGRIILNDQEISNKHRILKLTENIHHKYHLYNFIHHLKNLNK